MSATELTVCPDCALWVANRDDSGASELWLAWREANLAELGWLARMTPAYTDPEPTGAEPELVEYSFSTAPCDGCRSTLAGARIGVILD